MAYKRAARRGNRRPFRLPCHARLHRRAHPGYPQTKVIGSYGAQLLDWLHNYTFVEEQKFADPAHSPGSPRSLSTNFSAVERRRRWSIALSIRNRSTPSSRRPSGVARAMIAGKVMMDRNAPKALMDTAQQGYDESKALIERWRGRGRLDYAITPRFAVTSTPGAIGGGGRAGPRVS